MYLTILTQVHVALSLIGIFSGFIVVFGLIAGKRLDGWTGVFLSTTLAASVTGFFFPIHHFTPGIALGILSLITLALAIYARYSKQLQGSWRKTYVITAAISLYFNFFVAIVQSFMKIPALKAMAPTQTEPPFKIAQLVTLVIFIVLTIVAAIKFREESIQTI